MSSRTPNKVIVPKANGTRRYRDGSYKDVTPRSMYDIPHASKSLFEARMSNSDMTEIKHGQVFLLKYRPGKMKGRYILVTLKDGVDEGGHYIYFTIIVSSKNGKDWTNEHNKELLDNIGMLQSFLPFSTHEVKNKKSYYKHSYPDMEITDLDLLKNVSSNKKQFNLTYMPIESIMYMGNNLDMSKKEEYKKVFDDLMEQHGKKIYISNELWEHILQFLSGEFNYKKHIRDTEASRTLGGKRTRSAKKNRSCRKR
jgi:hypothetical protein